MEKMMTAEEKMTWVERFKKLPCGNVADAMDVLKIRRGSIVGLHPIQADQPRTVGFAHTVLQKRREKEWDGVNLAKQGRVIDEVLGEGDLLVISVNGIREVATCGGLLALRSLMKGAQGLLTDGCLRDVDEMIEIGFHAYSYGSAPNKSAYDIETAGVDVPVMLEGVMIKPGDLIVMDRTGVVAVPAEHIEEVYNRAVEIDRKEEKIVQYLREGKSLKEARALSLIHI